MSKRHLGGGLVSKRRLRHPGVPKNLKPQGIEGMAKGGTGGLAPSRENLCPSRYDVATKGLVLCDYPDDGHQLHHNRATGARWHEDYCPQEGK